MKPLRNIHWENGTERLTWAPVWSLQKKARLLILGALLAWGNIADAKPLSVEEELLRSKKSNTELLQRNIELESKLSEIRSIFKNLEIQLPENIDRPEVIFDTNGELTVDGDKFLKEIFPWEITKISQELENLKSKNNHETAEYIQKITLYLLASIALLTIIWWMAVVSLPFITVLKGIKAYNSTLKILEKYLPKWLYDFLKTSLDHVFQKIGIKKTENSHENWKKIQGINVWETVNLIEKWSKVLIKITKKEQERILWEANIEGQTIEIWFTSDGYEFHMPWKDSEIKK